MSRPAPRRPGARRGRSSSSDWCRLQQFQLPNRAAGRRRQPDPAPQIRLWHVGRVPRRPGASRTSPMPTPTPNRWISAARWARPAASASRRYATRLRVRGAAPSRCRRNTRPPPSLTPAGIMIFGHRTPAGAARAAPAPAMIPATCNGVPCTGAGTAINGNLGQDHRAQPHRRLLLGAALGACRLCRRTRPARCQ